MNRFWIVYIITMCILVGVNLKWFIKYLTRSKEVPKGSFGGSFPDFVYPAKLATPTLTPEYKKENPRIIFCTTCKGRAQHIKGTLLQNLSDNQYENSKFLVLDYSSQDDLVKYLKTKFQPMIDSGKLIVYSFKGAQTFHVSHAKNMAARLGILEGADILVTLDADNFTGLGFDRFILEKMKEPNTFLCPDIETIQKMPWGPDRPLRGFAGRLAVRAQDFIKAGGYDEAYNTWRGEDTDFKMRMIRMGYIPRYIDLKYLRTIPHTAEVRFKEYPHAKQYEAPGAWKIKGKEINTVVNYSKFGMGTAFKNFSTQPIVLDSVPTRVFGIGMHKTATTSLHKAFQILGYDSLHWGSGEAPAIWNEVNSAGRSKTLEKFYSLCDMPIPLLYKQLDQFYPGSKFILTVRNEERWLRSVERLWNAEYNPTRWEWDVWPISNTLHKAMYGRIDFDRDTMLARYRKHNAEVKEYFKNRSGDLLVLDMDKGNTWDVLCSFLGCSIPNTKYPMEYVTVKQENSECAKPFCI